MRYFKSAVFISILFFVCHCAGCVKPPPPSAAVAEADETFQRICKEDFGYEVKTKIFEHTYWIYFPFEYDIGALKPGETNTKFIPEHINGYFHQGSFHIEYDLVPRRKPKSPLIKYTDEFNERYANIFAALSQSFFETGKPPEGIDFLKIILADTKNGIKFEALIHAEDFTNSLSGFLPNDEYSKRLVSNLDGDGNLIGDKKGKAIDFHDITWPEFITEQILHRIRFKFGSSDFPPSDDLEAEILAIVMLTIHYYDFEDFQAVNLHDLRNDLNYSFDKSELKTLK